MATPPGVYFNPSPEECVRDYLRPWIESGCGLAPIHGSVFPTDVYSQSPGALAETFPCGHARKKESSWYFLARGSPRKRTVATGGHWKVEQKPKELLDGKDKRRTFKFYGPDKSKTAWLMEEMGSDGGRGRGKAASAPVFCRIYVRRAALGEDAVAVGTDGKKKAVAVDVHDEYFDLLKAMLPPSCLRQQGHAAGVLLGGYQMADHAEAPPDFPDHHQFQHDDDALPPIIYGHQQDHATPPPAVHGQQHYDVVQADAPPVDFRGPHDEPHGHGLNDAGFDHPPAPPVDVPVPPQQGEEQTHAEKPRPRRTHASPVVAADSASLPNRRMELSEFQEEWDVAQVPNVHADYAAAAFLQDPLAPEQQSTLPPQQDSAWTAAALSLPPPPVTEFQVAPKDPSSSDRSTGSSNLTHVSLDDDDFRMACYEPQPLYFFDSTVPLGDLNNLDDIASWIHVFASEQ